MSRRGSRRAAEPSGPAIRTNRPGPNRSAARPSSPGSAKPSGAQSASQARAPASSSTGCGPPDSPVSPHPGPRRGRPGDPGPPNGSRRQQPARHRCVTQARSDSGYTGRPVDLSRDDVWHPRTQRPVREAEPREGLPHRCVHRSHRLKLVGLRRPALVELCAPSLGGPWKPVRCEAAWARWRRAGHHAACRGVRCVSLSGQTRSRTGRSPASEALPASSRPSSPLCLDVFDDLVELLGW